MFNQRDWSSIVEEGALTAYENPESSSVEATELALRCKKKRHLRKKYGRRKKS